MGETPIVTITEELTKIRRMMVALHEEMVEQRIVLANLEAAHTHLKKVKQDLEIMDQYPADKLLQDLARRELAVNG